ncbi:hypothetical protein V6N13_103112 [Hibiscus sabdariffa]
MDCEIVSVLITTNHEKRIEEAVEIEVHVVRVSEVGFKDDSAKLSRELETEGVREVEDEALIAVCSGKDYSNNEDNMDTLKNGEGISRNISTDSWQKETSKEVGSEPVSLASEKIINRVNFDPTQLQNQEEANWEFGPESPQIHESLDEQDSLASIFLGGTIDLVDSSSWEVPTNPPTSSVCCWNHSQASQCFDLMTTGEKRCIKRCLFSVWKMERLGCCMNVSMDLRDIRVITMKIWAQEDADDLQNEDSVESSEVDVK